jgi:hypothetical protein
LLRDFRYRGFFVTVNFRGVTRDDAQVPEPGQSGNDIGGNAVGEEGLLGVGAQVFERQYRDRRYSRLPVRGFII